MIAFKKTLTLGLSLSLFSNLAFAESKAEIPEFRALSEQGIMVVAKRVARGNPISDAALKRVADVDTAYLANIDFFKNLPKCETFDEKLVGYTPTSKVETHYEIAEQINGKDENKSCKLTSQTVTSTTDFTIKCDLTEADVAIIAKEGVVAYSDAIKRFRNDGLYSLVSPSPTMTKLQQTKKCSMSISASSFTE